MLPHHWTVLRALGSVWSLLLCLLLTGCASQGPTKGTVSGRVTYQGKLLPSGTVVLVPEKGHAVTGIITDGYYTIADVALGPARIAVQPDPPNS